MKYILVAVVILLLNTAHCRPGKDNDYDPDFTENDRDMQNDNNEDYSDLDDVEEGTDIPEPEIITRGQDFIAQENETVYLPCEISNADTLVTFWKKKNEIIFQDKILFNNFGNNYERLPNRTLVIKRVSASDVGEFTCSLPISETNDMSVTHRVFVKLPPSNITLEAADNKTIYEKGQTLVLRCEASGFPKPTIIWSFKGKRLAKGDSFTIDDIDHSHAGSYQCLADNKVGEPAHKSIRINVVHKPIVKIEKLTVNSAENYDSELICTVHAVPEAQVVWKKNDLNVKPDDRISIRRDGHNYILKITKTQISDFGEYTCSAYNRVGKSEKTVSLTGTPSPAQFSKGFEDPERKVPVLSWTIESNSPITEHVLQYRKVGEASWTITKPEVTNPIGNIYTIKQALEDLSQGQYEARVRSKNTYGWSQWSEHKTFSGVFAPRTHKHHLHSSTTYDINHAAPETKSLENEITKENIRQGASSQNNSQVSILPSVSIICLLISFVLAYQH